MKEESCIDVIVSRLTWKPVLGKQYIGKLGAQAFFNIYITEMDITGLET